MTTLFLPAVASGGPTVDIIHNCDAMTLLKALPDGCVNTIISSPPYFGLRSYVDADSPLKSMEIGLEDTPQAFVQRLVDVFHEARRVLRDDGTLWLNLGDSYNSGAQFNNGRSTTALATQGKIYRESVVDQKWPGHRALIPGLKAKDLIGIPWMVAFALRADGWYLRSDIIWAKKNSMPESVTDRPTKAHEYIFLLAKSERYFYDADAIKDPASESSMARLERAVSDQHKNINGAPGQIPHTLSQPRPNLKQDGTGNRRYTGFNERYDSAPKNMANKRTVWNVATQSFPDAHFATFPPKLIEPCILAGCPKGGLVLDPFSGAGTTALVAKQHGRHYIGCDLNPEYVQMANLRVNGTGIDRLNAKDPAPITDLPMFAALESEVV